MCEQHVMKRLTPCLTFTALAALAVLPLGLNSALAQGKGDRGLGAAAESRFIVERGKIGKILTQTTPAAT